MGLFGGGKVVVKIEDKVVGVGEEVVNGVINVVKMVEEKVLVVWEVELEN